MLSSKSAQFLEFMDLRTRTTANEMLTFMKIYDATQTSSEQCRESRTMSRVVVVVFRGRQCQKPQRDRAASVLQSHHDPVRHNVWRSTIFDNTDSRVGIVGGLNPPPTVHVYRGSFLSENRLYISIPGQNFKHFDIWPPVLLGQFQHWPTGLISVCV